MSPASRYNRDPVVEDVEHPSNVRDEVIGFFLRGMERAAEMHKQAIDLAVQQNQDLVDLLKKSAEKMPGMPRVPGTELAAGAVSRYADTQKAAIDFAVEQSRAWTGALQDRANTTTKAGEATADMAKQAVARSFAVHKKALENTAAHTKAVVEAARRQFGITGPQADAMTETFQRGVDTFVDAQKEFLDIVTH